MLAGLVLLAGARMTAAEGDDRFAWVRGDGWVALLDEAERVVWRFNWGERGAIPHFHPFGLAGGPPMTWHAPEDHPWHYGLWFAWKYINGVNYWEFDRETRRHAGWTIVEGAEITTRRDGSARIDLRLTYRPGPEADPVLREHRVIAVSAPGEDGGYHFDWRMTFRAADVEVSLDRTPIPGQPEGRPWGGYAGLIWRFAREFADWQVVNDKGERDRACHGRRARAIDFSGRIGGECMGVAIFDHPDNIRYPTPWYVGFDPKTPFACVLPAPLFESGLRLSPGGELTLRYRVAVHPGRLDAEALRAGHDDDY